MADLCIHITVPMLCRRSSRRALGTFLRHWGDSHREVHAESSLEPHAIYAGRRLALCALLLASRTARLLTAGIEIHPCNVYERVFNVPPLVDFRIARVISALSPMHPLLWSRWNV